MREATSFAKGTYAYPMTEKNTVETGRNSLKI